MVYRGLVTLHFCNIKAIKLMSYPCTIMSTYDLISHI